MRTTHYSTPEAVTSRFESPNVGKELEAVGLSCVGDNEVIPRAASLRASGRGGRVPGTVLGPAESSRWYFCYYSVTSESTGEGRLLFASEAFSVFLFWYAGNVRRPLP